MENLNFNPCEIEIPKHIFIFERYENLEGWNDEDLEDIIRELRDDISENFTLIITADMEEMLKELSPDTYLVIINDLEFTEAGILIKRIREQGLKIPIIVKNQEYSTYQSASIFELGADRCLPSDEDKKVLLRHIQAVLKREVPISKRERRFVAISNDILIDRKLGILFHSDGSYDKLSGRILETLELLLSNRNKPITSIDILKATSGFGHRTNPHQMIHRLREFLKDDPKNPQIILTVESVGYKLSHIK